MVTILGRRHLEGLDGTGVLVLGNPLDSEASAAFAELLPRARFESLDAHASFAAARSALAGAHYRAIVLAQNHRKLKALALALSAEKRLVLDDGHLASFGVGDLIAHQARALDFQLLDGAVQKSGTRVRRKVRRSIANLLGTKLGAGNDYGFVEERMARLGPSWPKLRASIVLPVYNRKLVLEKTIAGILQQTYPRELIEVIVADDGSSDHPEELVDRYRDQLDIRIVSQEDLGFRAARVRNLGIEAAKGEVIVLLDCDMLPEPQLIASMMRWFHATEEPIVVIGDRRFVNTDALSPAEIRESFDRVRALPEIEAPLAVRLLDAPTEDWRRRHYRNDAFKANPAPYRFSCSGNLAFFRRDARAAGLFDEAYNKWGGEDIEFGYRLHRLGAYFIPELDAIAYHQDHPSSVVREEDQKTTRRMTEGKIPHLRKNEPDVGYEVPKISVLVFGSDARLIARTKASLAAQSFTDFEIVVASSEQDALQRARGEYVIDLAAGQRLEPEALELLLHPFERRPEVVLSLGTYRVEPGERGCAPDGPPRLIRIRDLLRIGGLGGMRGATEEWREQLASRGAIVTIEELVMRCEQDGAAREVRPTPWYRAALGHARKGHWHEAVSEVLGRI